MKRMNSRVISAVAILGLAAVTGGVLTTGAFNSDAVEITPNTFASGTFDLSMDPAVVPFAVTNMQPGDVVYKAVPLTNAGTMDLRYTMTETNGPVQPQLIDTLQVAVKAFPTGGSDNCQSGATFDAAPDLYNGPLGTVAAIGDPSIAMVGDANFGAQAGDRNLAPGAGEVLCLAVTFPSMAFAPDSQVVNGVTFSIVAEQTLNNP